MGVDWLGATLAETAEQLCVDETLPTFQQSLPSAWIEQALQTSGVASLRRRRLPAEQVVWLVLGMAILRDRPIDDVVEKLDLVLPNSGRTPITKGALVAARNRLGESPLRDLFQRTGTEWAKRRAARDAWRGLSVLAVDGTTLRVPDSAENESEFGLASGGSDDSGYPLVRLVALSAARSHLLVDAHFGPYATGEHTLTDKCLDAIPPDSVTIFDKNFVAEKYMVGLESRGENRHWLMRAKKSTIWTEVRKLGPGDYLVKRSVSSKARKRHPHLPREYFARAIAYQFPDSERPQWLITSLLDSEKYPAGEVVALYHERWEIELAYDEVKTHLLNRTESIRSRSPERVRQELWGILLAYNLVRLEMCNIAEEARVKPIRISFVMATRFIRDEWFWCAGAAPGSIPGKLRRMRARVAEFVLPERRSERRYPRQVKIAKSKYPKKKRKRVTGADRNAPPPLQIDREASM